MYRLLIVENEPEEAEVLMRNFERYSNARGVQFRISWLKSAVEFLCNPAEYDCLFLDIDLPGVNGMEAAQMVRVYDQATPIVFVTNLAQYALHGYEVDAVDFMVKPISYPNFCAHMDKIMRAVDNARGASMAVQTRDGTRVVELRDLELVEVKGHYLTYRLASGECLQSHGTLRGFEEDCAHPALIRVSNSAVVNAQNVVAIRGREVSLASGGTVQISHGCKKQAAVDFANYFGGSR